MIYTDTTPTIWVEICKFYCPYIVQICVTNDATWWRNSSTESVNQSYLHLEKFADITVNLRPLKWDTPRPLGTCLFCLHHLWTQKLDRNSLVVSIRFLCFLHWCSHAMGERKINKKIIWVTVKLKCYSGVPWNGVEILISFPLPAVK